MSYIGTIKIGQMYLGSIKIGKVYLGGTLVFSGEVPVVIVFEDPNVEAIAVVQWGNGTTLTERQAAAVTALNNAFKSNTNIISFNELEYFTGLTGIMGYTGAGSNVQGQFYGCTSLEEITMSSNVATIDHACFRGCTSLETVSGGALTTINSYAFYGCSSLTSINMSSVTSIGNYAFTNASLDGFTLHCPNLTSLGQLAFRNTSLYRVTSLGNITEIPSDGSGGNGGCFAYCSKLTEVTLPNSVTAIPAYAFNYCESLTTVSCAWSSITSIGAYAFRSCILSSLELNLASLTSIGSAAFMSTSITKILSLGSITELPNSNVNAQIFGGCSSLMSIVLPTTLQTVGHYALYRLTGLTSVTFQSNVTTIGQYAFQGCSALTTINIPSSVTSIGTYAFGGCTNMTGNFTLNNLTSVTGRAFSETGITGVSITSATTVGSYSFYRCRSLAYVTLSPNLTTIETYAFQGDNSLATANIPSGVTTIGTAAFYGCSSLTGDVTLTQLTEVTGSAFRGTAHTSFTLPAVVAIRSYAFYDNSSLTAVDIGPNCTTIETYAMGYCSSLATVIVRATTPPSLTSTTALSNNANLKIWVPNGTLSAYQAATNWSTFASKMDELDSNGNIPV